MVGFKAANAVAWVFGPARLHLVVVSVGGCVGVSANTVGICVVWVAVPALGKPGGTRSCVVAAMSCVDKSLQGDVRARETRKDAEILSCLT